MTTSSDGKCGMFTKKPLAEVGDMFTKKPLAEVGDKDSAGHTALERTLSLYDLIVVGVAGTIGSGVFALVGLITVRYAGAAGMLSWLLAGIGCGLSGLSYTELGATFKGDGGAYGYSYAALGEIFAVITAYCLTMEFGISASAVARNWGDKMVVWLGAIYDELPTEGVEKAAWYEAYITVVRSDYAANILAGLLQLAVCLLLYKGMTVSKGVLNFFTVLKMLLIVFMIAMGLYLFTPTNLAPFAPYGAAGVLRGSTAAFFGYLGFDEVAVLSAEAKRPLRDIPLALCVCIVTITSIHVLAAIAIAGLVPFDTVDPDSAFLVAFVDRGYYAIGHIVAVGELISLPLVVLACFLAQPRILHAMAVDGLLPELFAESSLSKSTLISGVVCSVVAAVASFEVLDDMISASVLLAFNLTNSSLIALKRGALLPSPPPPPSSSSSSSLSLPCSAAATCSPVQSSSKCLLLTPPPTPLSPTPLAAILTPPSPSSSSSSSSLSLSSSSSSSASSTSSLSLLQYSTHTHAAGYKADTGSSNGRSRYTNSNPNPNPNSSSGGNGNNKTSTLTRLTADAQNKPQYSNASSGKSSNNNSGGGGGGGGGVADGWVARRLLYVLPSSPSRRCSMLVLLLNVFCLLAGGCLHVSFSPPSSSLSSSSLDHSTTTPSVTSSPVTASLLPHVMYILSMVCWSCAAATCGCIAYLCPEISLYDAHASGIEAFEVPFGPLIPSLGIAVNCLLLCLLSTTSLMYSAVALCVVCVFYMLYGAKGSKLRHHDHHHHAIEDDDLTNKMCSKEAGAQTSSSSSTSCVVASVTKQQRQGMDDDDADSYVQLPPDVESAAASASWKDEAGEQQRLLKPPNQGLQAQAAATVMRPWAGSVGITPKPSFPNPFPRYSSCG